MCDRCEKLADRKNWEPHKCHALCGFHCGETIADEDGGARARVALQ